MNGKRLGIVGMGRIGQAIAKRARGFGMSIHYHNRNQLHPEIESDLEATWWENLNQMISRMDIISINCPHTDLTHRMIGKEQLNLIQKHAFLVNTARGGIVNEQALLQALENNKVSAAGLEVFENEPNPSVKLLMHPKISLTPHTGASTKRHKKELELN